MEEKDFDYMLENPLLTEDGFLNEACWNELCSAIKNCPKLHDRCDNDIEWTKKRITAVREITGGLAYWAVRQIGCCPPADEGPIVPPNLEKVIGYLHTCIRPKFDKFGWAQLSLCDISKMIYGILYEQGISCFDEWNTKEVMGDYWLDLDALITNVCITIRDERRKNDEFDKKFDEEWKKKTEQKEPE